MMHNKGDTLVILTPAFTTENGESYLSSQEAFIRTLNKNYPDLKVIILSFHFPVVKAKTYQWFGNKVIPFNGNMKGGMNSMLLWMRVWRQLIALKKRHRLIGIFSFFCSECAFAGHYFAKWHKLKHYIWILGQDAKKDNKQVKRIRPKADELIAISDFLADEFEKNHAIRPAHIIPIGINPDNFSKKKYNRSIDIIGAGSLIPLKRYDIFIDVIAALQKHLPNIQSVFYGNGAEQAMLKEKIKELGLEKNISMPGKKSHAATLQLMQQSRVLLHPSEYEGFGMVCAEALYAGAHVISFCKPMNADIPNWHIVKDKEEMIALAYRLLQDEHTTYDRVFPWNMNDSAASIMQLFGY